LYVCCRAVTVLIDSVSSAVIGNFAPLILINQSPLSWDLIAYVINMVGIAVVELYDGDVGGSVWGDWIEIGPDERVFEGIYIAIGRLGIADVRRWRRDYNLLDRGHITELILIDLVGIIRGFVHI
jgi:hypothetical protein